MKFATLELFERRSENGRKGEMKMQREEKWQTERTRWEVGA